MRGRAVHHRIISFVVALAAVIGTGATFIAFAGPQATAAPDATAAPTTPTPSTTGNSGATVSGQTGTTGTTGNTGTGSGSPAATTGTTSTTTTTTPAPPPGDSATTATPAAAGTTGAAASASTPSAGSAAPADPSSTVEDGTVIWTGNGTTDGLCVNEENLGVTVPAGMQAWLFILTSPGDPGTGQFTLTTNLGDATGTQEGNGSVHFIIVTPLGAQLTSASAAPGTANSVLTVSGCQFGTPLISGSTTSTVVFDATTNDRWSGTETVGATAYDTATVTPTTPGGPVPTGTVTFTFFTNGSCDGPGAPQTVMLNGDGTVPHTSTSLPLAQGHYSYDAVYNGDSNYGASPVSSCEPFSVGRVTPTISTVVFNATTNAPLVGGEPAGTTTKDTSTLAGLIVGFAPTGTVTYTFFPNGNCTVPGTTETVTLAGGAIPNSPISLPLPAGSYSYDAVYSGDDNYDPSVPGPCEPFTLAPTTSSSTTGGSTTSGSTATSATTAPATRPATTASVAGAAIAFTGADLSAMFAAGLVLMATGSVLLLDSRRRRRRA